MTTYTWAHKGSGNWTDKADWTPNGQPGSSDSVVIESGTSEITTPKVFDVASLIVDSTLVISNDANAFNGPGLTVSGDTVINGALYIGGGSSGVVEGLSTGGTLTIDGTVRLGPTASFQTDFVASNVIDNSKITILTGTHALIGAGYGADIRSFGGDGSVELYGLSNVQIVGEVDNTISVDLHHNGEKIALNDPSLFHAHIENFGGNDALQLIAGGFVYGDTKLAYHENAADTLGILKATDGSNVATFYFADASDPSYYSAAGFYVVNNHTAASIRFAPA